MSAEDWNQAYIRGTLRRKRDMDYVMPTPTDTSNMRPELDEAYEDEGKVIVGVLIIICILIVGGFSLAGWLS